jgi:hypothetical protein
VRRKEKERNELFEVVNTERVRVCSLSVESFLYMVSRSEYSRETRERGREEGED